jgi:hypothetical protein
MICLGSVLLLYYTKGRAKFNVAMAKNREGQRPRSQGDQVAPLVRIALHLSAILAAYVPLKLVYWCCFRSLHHIIKRHSWRRLRWFLVAEHPIIPRLTREPISVLAASLACSADMRIVVP